MANVTLSLVVLRCKSLDTTLKFYQRLGLRFVQEQHGNGPLHYAATLNGTVIELYPQREMSSQNIEPMRIAFTVCPLNDTLQLMQEIGVQVKRQNEAKAIVLDPDGRTIELVEKSNASQE